jgi:hypothetical protein
MCYHGMKYFSMKESRLVSWKQSIFTALMLSLVMGTMLTLADFSPTSLSEGYQAPSIPSRDDLATRIPQAPRVPETDPATLRQSGTTLLQQFNPDIANDHDAIRQQIGALSGEVAHPDSGSPSDPLGNNAATGQNTQSSVSGTGTLPAGTISAEPRPSQLGQSAVDRYGRDALQSWYNSLAATMVLRAEVVTQETKKLADMFDEVNTIHKEINQYWKDLNSTSNAILVQLPTNPGR